MESTRPMDRLVCGDVGFGKTEVAVRATFKAVQAGLQVAVLVPTTVLAQQHYQTFAERMAPYPVRVEAVSRFRSAGEQRQIMEEVKSGAVDIVIGTHRLLQKDVEFHNLGLVVVDEEQRFGVLQKEKLKELRAEVDLLTLSATPIPRTMHQAMGGLREISLITDPPSGRLPVRTYVMPFKDEVVRDAIERELEREGQIYYVHNRIGSIYHVAEKLKELVPQLRISIGHGQMADGDLEQVMLDFMHHRTDVLLATTIIENGLDLPNVNTLIVDRAERLGLSQMYQLRGRVGRSSRQAYAYFLRGTQSKIKAAAEERFSALQENTDLGSGFKIAMRDLEIRGAGDLLGTKQSGNIEAVGFELYTQMLAEAVENLKSGHRRSRRKQDQLPTVDIPLSAYLPEDYIASEADRLEMYQKLSNLTDADDIGAVRAELRDRFGLLPLPVNQLLRACAIRLHLQHAVLRGITHHNGEVIIRTKTGDNFTDADMSAAYVKLNKAADQRTLVNITFRQKEGLVFNANALNESTLLRLVEIACSALAEVRGERLLGI
jgi:transcription-repair coupling factor (superfamily II helicase)